MIRDYTEERGGDMKRILSVENINEEVSADPRGFAIRSEEYYHRQLAEIAAQLLRRKEEKPFILISGPSGSGKTTTAHRIEDYINNYGVRTITISLDDYYLPIAQRPEFVTDFESPYCVDLELLRRDLECLRRHEEVTLPRFHFAKQERQQGATVRLQDGDMVIMEGLHALNPLLTEQSLPYATGIYIAPRTRLECEGDLLQPQQLRLARRMLRDHFFRGRSFEQIVQQAKSVDAGEDRYVRPYKKNAALSCDTFLDYELCVFAGIMQERGAIARQFDPDFVRENHLEPLLRALEKIRPLPAEYVPKNSLIREFIGGSSVLNE